MDPLSLTASIIAVLGAGGIVAKGIRRLICLRDIPKSFLLLNNELSDLQTVIAVVQDLHVQNSQILEAEKPAGIILYNALKEAKVVVLDLETLIEYALTKVTVHGTRISRKIWIQEESKIQRMKDRIRIVRVDVTTATSILGLYVLGFLLVNASIDIRITPQRLHFTSRALLSSDAPSY